MVTSLDLSPTVLEKVSQRKWETGQARGCTLSLHEPGESEW